ncbi:MULTISPECIES: Na(+)/H(+) antiporter subunit B [Metabacillus]|jgi:multicomponent Na+:H+ antiporter subunit B|uniref:Na(+)/H(+) antiporter subunit B n=1 Tax=Metabacillus rhizolycopersici TaxID=2875709 RepID=A0ABS7UWA0_9BACI|nr:MULTISPECIES: Na(+)/H(+) antiporter subunit B [Metabacillus]MBZ5752324.1 Na(+)/H(+) antiporter subunit B [Metabacillus rhizolycopersici]MCM3651409.1 Na(+)/H(+) antiporter subunit B [Metabacillus litoralis]
MKTNNIILETSIKVLLFINLLYSVYIFTAGHYYPGGGFIGGLMTAGAIVLLLITYDIKTVAKILPINYRILTAIGLLFAIGTSAGSLLFNVPFLTHVFTDVDVPLLGELSLHTATLFDLGVYFVVVGVTMTIIQTIGEDE